MPTLPTDSLPNGAGSNPLRRSGWLRFSLRTLLVVVTLACILLGTWVSRSIRQRNALAGLHKSEMDLRVCYDYEFDANGKPTGADPPGPAWLREPLGIDFFAMVVGIDFYRGATDADLGWLKQLPGLRTCEIFESPLVTDEGIAQLGAARGLKKLGLYNLEINGAGLASLRDCPSLQDLTICSCSKLTDSGIAHVGSIANLRAFSMIATPNVTNAGFAELRRLAHLEELGLDFSIATDDAVLESLGSLANLRKLALAYGERESREGLAFLKNLRSLETLTLYGHAGLTDAALTHLAAPASLTHLSLMDCKNVTDSALASLIRLPELEELTLYNVKAVGDAGMAHLQRLPKLKQLSIYGDGIPLTDAGLVSIAACPHLRRLMLLSCGIVSDAGVESLGQLPGLEELIIEVDRTSRVTSTGFWNLAQQLPKCRVVYRQHAPGF